MRKERCARENPFISMNYDQMLPDGKKFLHQPNSQKISLMDGIDPREPSMGRFALNVSIYEKQLKAACIEKDVCSPSSVRLATTLLLEHLSVGCARSTTRAPSLDLGVVTLAKGWEMDQAQGEPGRLRSRRAYE